MNAQERFHNRVMWHLRVYAMSIPDAVELCVEQDWIAAKSEQCARNSAVAGFAAAYKIGQERATNAHWLESEYGIAFDDACDWVTIGRWNVYAARIRTPREYIPVKPVPVPMVWLDGRIEHHTHSGHQGGKTQAMGDQVSANRHRERRKRHAADVCAPGGAFDNESVPLGVSITIGERLERLEAAVLLMAAHDPTGPIKSARHFLSLMVTDKLRNVLLRRVKRYD